MGPDSRSCLKHKETAAPEVMSEHPGLIIFSARHRLSLWLCRVKNKISRLFPPDSRSLRRLYYLARRRLLLHTVFLFLTVERHLFFFYRGGFEKQKQMQPVIRMSTAKKNLNKSNERLIVLVLWGRIYVDAALTASARSCDTSTPPPDWTLTLFLPVNF